MQTYQLLQKPSGVSRKVSAKAEVSLPELPYIKQKNGKAANKVQLGSSDLMVTECCLGTMTWGMQNTEKEAHEQLSYALDRGINFLDTAEVYPVPPEESTQGLTEKYIGTWMKDQKREDIIVATKVAGYGDRTNYLRGETSRVNKAQVKVAIENSLERLGTDYVDLLQIHWPDRYVPLFGLSSYKFDMERSYEAFEDQLRALDELVKEGKVRHIGVSNETSFGVMSFKFAAEKYNLPQMVSIQNCYHLNCRIAYETDLIESCRQANVGLLAYSPLAGGTLTGKYLGVNEDSVDPKARLNVFKGYMGRYLKSDAAKAVQLYADCAKKYDVSATELALAFVKDRQFVTSTIIGATSLEQLKANIDAFDVTLPEECYTEIGQIYDQYRDPSRI